MDEVYNKVERDQILKNMEAVSTAFYAGAIQTHCHPFIEFCGLMREYVNLCKRASDDGQDFTQANQHSGQALPMPAFAAAYLGEKIGCIYGPSLADPDTFKAFIEALHLPFKVELAPSNTDADLIDET